MSVPDFLIWRCAGCGAPAHGKKKPCDCATNVGTRWGPNGEHEQTWWDDSVEDTRQGITIPIRRIVAALEGTAANTDTDPRWIAATALRGISDWEKRLLNINWHEPQIAKPTAAIAGPSLLRPAEKPYDYRCDCCDNGLNAEWDFCPYCGKIQREEPSGLCLAGLASNKACRPDNTLKRCTICGFVVDTQYAAEKPTTHLRPTKEAPAQPPYPFCRTPDRCAGRGYCTRDPACNE